MDSEINMRKWWWYGAMCLVMSMQSSGVAAQPRLDRPMALQPDEIAVGVRGGELKQWLLPAPHREMAYRIRVWVPDGPVPEGGWPVVYLLDGDAAFESLTTTAQRLPSAPTPQAVLVGVGYDSPVRFASDARAYDYTPPVPGAEAPVGSPRDPRAASQLKEGGGAGMLAQILIRQVEPEVARLAPLHPEKQMVWGHSYGGLAVLYLLERYAEAFQHFVAVSPSLWWHRQSYAERLIHAPAQTVPTGTRLTLFDGGDTEPPHTLTVIRQVKQALARWPGLQIDEQAFPGVSHGQMFPNGLASALHAYLR